ncbi:MAG: extracellular solute-binding protein [Minwuia sp.]|uniref:extracellular solute-binding protein n=1 Tax=Minwuia sp. TaxID=2493630 RepID=UPI003A87D062
MRLAAFLIAGLALAGSALAEPRHGISVFGQLEYPEGFEHYNWVNPEAPKGGMLRLRDLGTFDSVNFYILRGATPASIQQHEIRLHDTLMARSYDEPDAHYALIARTADVAADGRSVTFEIDERARFHDGSPILAADAVFSLEVIQEKGHPILRNVFEKASAAIVAERTVRFDLAEDAPRDLAVKIAGSLPILSAAYYETVEFDKTTLTPPLASGPYRMTEVNQGTSITLERVTDYWAKDLPVNKGLWNFDTIRIDWYADRTSALLAFFADEYDFREEFTSKSWATEYDDKVPVQEGRIKRLTVSDGRASGMQGWFYNTRRGKFADRRVREALDLAFDFEWTNRNLFYGLYKRTQSIFENSVLLKHSGPPSDAEKALLQPFADELPPEVMTKAFQGPVTDGENGIRQNLRKAHGLLKEAGWTIQDGVLKNADGEVFTIEFLSYQPTFDRIIGPYAQNLERLGIKAGTRLVDPAQYVERIKKYDFDAVTARFSPPETPGAELWNFFGSRQADIDGTYNYAGVKSPAVDSLIATALAAPDRETLVTALRALDRVIMWGRYIVPQWYKGEHNLAYWDRYGRPEAEKPPYHRGVVNSWWFDAGKAAATGGRNN